MPLTLKAIRRMFGHRGRSGGRHQQSPQPADPLLAPQQAVGNQAMVNAQGATHRKLFYHVVKPEWRIGDEELESIDALVDRRKAADATVGRAPQTGRVDAHRPTGALRHLDPTTQLYIVGHGRMGQETMGQHGRTSALRRPKTRITAEALADHLIQDGLSQNHRVIKVWACWSGVCMPGQQESYARRLARALYARGFRQCIVDGYAGSVHVDTRRIPGSQRTKLTKNIALVMQLYEDEVKGKTMKLVRDNLDFDGVPYGILRGLRTQMHFKPKGLKAGFRTDADASSVLRDEAVGRAIRDDEGNLWIVIETTETRGALDTWRRNPDFRP